MLANLLGDLFLPLLLDKEYVDILLDYQLDKKWVYLL